MRTTISITFDDAEDQVFQDLLETIETIASYMVDNIDVRTTYTEEQK